MAVDLAQISRLTNLQDVHRLLHDTLSKEISVDAELNKLLGRRVEFEARLLQLNPPTREALELVRADAEQLLASVRGTSAQAEAISSKVRRLDLAQSRVQETLAEVNLILDRTNCIHGVQQAMENGDYASAAQYIATFMSLEEKLSRSAVAQHADDLAQAAEQRQLLLDAKSRLEAVVEKHFGDAASRRDQPEVVKYARLYKLLGRREEGLKRFLDFLQLSIGARARSEYHTLSEKLDGRKPVRAARAVRYVLLLAVLFLLRMVYLTDTRERACAVLLLCCALCGVAVAGGLCGHADAAVQGPGPGV